MIAGELILDALCEAHARRPLHRVLLIGMQGCATVRETNALVGSANVALLHLDRATGAVWCGLGNREQFLGEEIGSGGTYSAIALDVEAAKSYRLLREIVAQTAHLVDADGVVLVAGPKKGGAEVAARVLEGLFTSVSLVTYRKGHRIYRAVGPRSGETQESVAATAADEQQPTKAHPGTAQAPEAETVQLRGRELRLLLDDRIFARGRLDPATRMLAEAFTVRPGAAVLDLGSGNGVLGILAALLEPSCEVTLVDSDPLAVGISGQNATLNSAANVTAHLSDVLREAPGQQYDIVLMNPPFHRGRRPDRTLAERFIAEASAALRPGGIMYVVCNRFLRYEPTLERAVGPVREIVGDAHFKVLMARRLQSRRYGGRDGRAE